MTDSAKYTATFQREKDGRWIVEIPEVPGAYGAGRTIDEARKAIRRALECLIKDSGDYAITEEISW